MKEKFIALLTFTSSLKNFGIKFIRVAILVVFVWIGGQRPQKSGRSLRSGKPRLARSQSHLYFLLWIRSAHHEYRYSGIPGHFLPESSAGR